MVKILEGIYSLLIGFVSGVLIVVFLWFFFAMAINFWKIYVRGPKKIKS